MTVLEDRLVLHHFLCREFGYPDLASMLERLRDVSAGFAVDEESEYARAVSESRRCSQSSGRSSSSQPNNSSRVILTSTPYRHCRRHYSRTLTRT